MKKIFTFLALFIFALVFYGCKKNTQDVTSSETKQSKLSITEARKWYSTSTTNKGSIVNAKTDPAKIKLANFTPLWDKALTTEDDKYFIVESPLMFDKGLGFKIKSTAKTPAVAINGATKLLILKDKITGEMISALMHIYSSTGSGAEKNTYGKRDETFSGYIFFTDTDENFINGWRYENGKITGQSKKGAATNKNTLKLLPSDGGTRECTTTETSWYYRDCDDHGCGQWNYIGSEYNTYCTGGGGGGGGGGG